MRSARTNHVVQLLQDPGLSVQEDSSGSDTAPCPPATQQLKLFMYHRALYAAGDWESGGEGTQRFGTSASLHRIRDSRPGRQQPPCIWFACGYTHVAVQSAAIPTRTTGAHACRVARPPWFPIGLTAPRLSQDSHSQRAELPSQPGRPAATKETSPGRPSATTKLLSRCLSRRAAHGRAPAAPAAPPLRAHPARLLRLLLAARPRRRWRRAGWCPP